jgi:tRNA G18 (ribose-2'-O)-methylase SpoU
MFEREPHGVNSAAGHWPARVVLPLHVVLADIRSAFNVGSIFRTADAAAAAGLYLCGCCAYPPNVKLAKTALGADQYVPWRHCGATAEALARLRAQGVPIIGVEAADPAAAHTAFPWPKPVAVVFGNEVDGLDAATLAACDKVVRIPMLGRKNSLNVATAAGIVMFEILRQWGALSDAPEIR